MSTSDPQNQQDKSLVSVRPRLRTVGRGASIAGDGRGGVAGPGYENTILSQLSTAKPVPLRSPLVTGLPTALTVSPPDRPDSCPGPVQQLLHQQHLHKEQLPMTERDSQIAMVEEELMLTRRMMELKRRQQEVDRMARQVEEEQRKKDVVLNGFGRFEDVTCDSETSEDAFKQIETARQEELARLTKDKLKHGSRSKMEVREMLERKKREMNLRNGTNSSAGSSLKEVFLKMTELQRSGNDLFNSDEETELVTLSGKPPKSKYYDDPTSLENDDLTSVLGEVIPDQKMIWERIQREKREEEERISGMKTNEVVQEQQDIMRKIQEQNLARKKEEELTFKLIAEMSLSDQRQQQQLQQCRHVASAATDYQAAAIALPTGARNRDVGHGHLVEDWSVVGAKAKEKMTSLKIAAELENKRRDTVLMDEWRREMLEREEEARRRQLRKWGVNQKVRVVKSVDSFQDGEDSRNGTTFRDILLNKNTSAINQKSQQSKDRGRRELGARRKSECLVDMGGERRKTAEDLKMKITAQEKELRARVEKEALEREWELARRRKETRGGSVTGQERAGQVSRHAKLEQNMNQKMRKQK